jgi:hypothetical protein
MSFEHAHNYLWVCPEVSMVCYTAALALPSVVLTIGEVENNRAKWAKIQKLLYMMEPKGV